MKLLIISQYYWPENFRINDIVKLLVNEGIEVTVLTGCPNYPSGLAFEGYSNYRKITEIHSDGYFIYRVPIILRGNSSSIRLFLNYISFILSGIIFSNSFLKDKKYDLVFVYGLSPLFQVIIGIYIKYIKKIPLITWIQDLWPDSLRLTGRIKNRYVLNFISLLVSWVYKKNDLLLVQSRGFFKHIKDNVGSVPIVYLPTPGEVKSNSLVDHSFYSFDYFLKDGFNLVFTGNLGSVQSLHTILDAAEILKQKEDIRIILIGSGSLKQWLSSEILNRNLYNIILTGPYKPEVMPQIFSKASALLVSLNSDPILNLTIPAKVQSYLAAGKPIIASLSGEGARIILEAKAGLVCQTENPVALSEAILKLKFMNSYELEMMGALGKDYFLNNFHPNIVVDNLINIFEHTINDSHNILLLNK